MVLDALLVASVVGFVAILAAGRLSDRFGRRPVFATGAGLALVSAVPIFALVNTENAVLITLGVVVGWGLAACIMFGPEGAMFAEVFPTRVRYSGMSAVYQIGVIPTGAVAPLIGTSLVERVERLGVAGGGLRDGDGRDLARLGVLPARDPPPRPA